jgi:hypothetical protein
MAPTLAVPPSRFRVVMGTAFPGVGADALTDGSGQLAGWCSNTTDYQARRADAVAAIAGEIEVLHTLNGTAIAVGRTLIAILENTNEPTAAFPCRTPSSPSAPRVSASCAGAPEPHLDRHAGPPENAR